jgi:hypothetical protein
MLIGRLQVPAAMPGHSTVTTCSGICLLSSPRQNAAKHEPKHIVAIVWVSMSALTSPLP